ncbi:MAG: hypothetical protein RBQ97_12190 [Acholeplasma sp.]|nr:hypothetical protein [Acholeplasma sp.]
MNSELIEKRINLYNRFIKNDESLDIKSVSEIFELIKIEDKTPWKFNLPFIRKCSKFILNEEKRSYEFVTDFYNLLQTEQLLDLVDENKKYDEFDMYALNMLKAYSHINDSTQNTIEVFNFYRKHTTKNILDDSYFYVYYNYVKNISSKEDFILIEQDFYELLKYRKDSFILMLPIRAYYLGVSQIAISLILLILKSKISQYDLNRIIKYLKMYDKSFENLEFIKIEEQANSFEAKRKLIKTIEDYCIKNIDSIENIFLGSLDRRKDNDFGFIQYGSKRVFTYLKNLNFKNGSKLLFAIFDSFDKSKKTNSYQGIIIKEMK